MDLKAQVEHVAGQSVTIVDSIYAGAAVTSGEAPFDWFLQCYDVVGLDADWTSGSRLGNFEFNDTGTLYVNVRMNEGERLYLVLMASAAYNLGFRWQTFHWHSTGQSNGTSSVDGGTGNIYIDTPPSDGLNQHIPKIEITPFDPETNQTPNENWTLDALRIVKYRID